MNRNKMIKRTVFAARRSLQYMRSKRTFSLAAHLSGSYLVTTDKGLLLLQGNSGRFLTTWTGYGIALLGDKIALVDEMEPRLSRVVILDRSSLLAGKYYWPNSAVSLPAIFEQPYNSTNGRIHQLMAVGDATILCAASEMNAVAKIDLPSGAIDLVHPFSDQFGYPIKSGDHNHINSVFADDDGVYFVAYKAGHSSMIGHIDSAGSLFGWAVEPKGYHDIYRTDHGFLVCDTFGRYEHGAIVSERGSLISDFMMHHALAPRGVGRDGDEWIFGYSHKGPRAKRFAGNGGLIVMRNEKPDLISLPSAQIYQIVQTDGSPMTTQTSGLRKALTSTFGSPSILTPVVGESDARAAE